MVHELSNRNILPRCPLEKVSFHHFYCHRAILQMTSVTENVKVELDKMLAIRDRANVMFEKVEAERTSFAEKEKNYEDRLNNMRGRAQHFHCLGAKADGRE